MTELYSTVRDTAATPVSRFLQNVERVRFNPTAIQRLMVEQVQDVLGGTVQLVDATNPYVNLMESQAVLTAGFIIENETTTRRQYAAVAQTIDDLYMHMSDKDYIDRFAVPAVARFRLMVNKEELISRMVLDPATNIRKVVVPRFSTVVVAETVFTLMYPIEIKMMQHGALSVVYDVDDPSPLQVLKNNEPPWTVRTLTSDRSDWVSIDFDTLQLRVSTVNSDINQATGYNKQLGFSDKYCYARVFYKNTATSNKWREIKTTHTEQVYDPSTPTAVLKVGDGLLGVHVPQVYLTQGSISGSLRVDIYTTKGEIRINTSNFKPSAFEGNWAPIDTSERTTYVAAWQAVRSLFVFTNEIVAGGAAELGFEALRQRVIMNAEGQRQIPITGPQIQESLTREGFEVVKYIDTVTEREYLATRVMPKPFDEKLVTAGSASIESLIISFNEALTHSKAIGHGERLTLVPEILYENVNGIVKIVPEAEQAALMALEPERRSLSVSARNFLYTPFHYVLDATNNAFELRPYYLDSPISETAMFVDQNDTTGLQVSTSEMGITRVAGGYRIVVKTVSNTAWRELDDSQAHVQIGYQPIGESVRCYLNGQIVGRTAQNEMIFEFFIETGFDVDSTDMIQLTGFKILNLDERIIPAGLEQMFDLIYSCSAPMPLGWANHSMDNLLGRFLLPNRIAGVTQEKISVTFGKALNNLWSSSRSIPSSAAHQTYSADVFATYESDVYSTDPVTGAAFSINPDGTISYNIVGRQGDVIMGTDGQPIILHRRGDVILTNGLPTPIGEAYLSRQIDMFFIDGIYYFADDYSTTTYRNEMVATVVGWITRDLQRMNDDLLEQTKVYFYPKVSMGSVRALIEGGNIAQVQAGQSLTARLYVGDATFDNVELRDALTTTTIEVIDAHFKKSTVSMSAITSELRQRYGNDVISVSLSGLGGLRNLEAITMLDDSERCSIRKKLAALPNGQLIVREDLTVDFLRHTQS